MLSIFLLLAFQLTASPAALVQNSTAPAAEDSREAEWRRLLERSREATELGRFDDATEMVLRALAFAERTFGRDHRHTIVTVNNLANLYERQGRYAEAEPLYLRAIQTSPADDPHTLLIMNNLGALYQHQGRHQEAEMMGLRALEAGEARFGRDSLLLIPLINNLASIYETMRRLTEAETLYLRALEIMRPFGTDDHEYVLAPLNGLATVYRSLGRYAEAEPLLLRVLDASERISGSDHPRTVLAISNLASLNASMGRVAVADELYAFVLGARQRTLGSDHPRTIFAAENLTGFRLSTPELSGSALEPARRLVAGLRARRATGPDDVWFEAQREREQRNAGPLFAHLADAAWQSSEAQPARRESLAGEAFMALQDSIAGATSRAVARMAARRVAATAGPDLPALVRERELLSEQWATNAANYSAALSGTEVWLEEVRQNLLADRRRIEVRLAAVETTLRNDFPQYFALVQPEAVALDAAREMLAPDEAILLVVPTPFGTHVVAVSRGGAQWTRSAWTQEEVNGAVRRLLWDVGANVDVSEEEAAAWRRQSPAGFAFDRRTAHALYGQIVAPVRGVLAGKRHVFIAAGGSLTSLPFGVLVSDEPRGSDADPQALRETSWFADAHALVQIPSVQSLQFLRRFPPSAGAGNRNYSFVGFGDPALRGAAVRRGRGRASRAPAAAALFLRGGTRSADGVADTREILRMSRLPGTAVELENLRQALGAPRESLFLAERATEANLRRLDLSRTRILVLATHGVMAGDLDGSAEPGLILTPGDEPGDVSNGLLTMSEIASLRLDAAEWVILSACNTAAGDGSQGAPGLSGLARAFFYAGARNLLASHWPVRDDVAAQLTVKTVQLLREQPELSRAEAFQRAMREIRGDASHDAADDSWAHPNAWAPFTLIGDGAR